MVDAQERLGKVRERGMQVLSLPPAPSHMHTHTPTHIPPHISKKVPGVLDYKAGNIVEA